MESPTKKLPKHKAYLQLTRPFFKWLIFMFSVTCGLFMGFGGIPPVDKWILSILVFGAISQSAIRAMNDYFDIEIDLKHDKDPFKDTRMLLHGHLLDEEVLLFAIVLHITGFVIAWFLGMTFFLCFIAVMILSYLYSGHPRIKHKFIINSIFISIGYVTLPIIAGFSLFRSMNDFPWLLIIILTWLCFGSNSVKDFTDIQWDKEHGVKNFVTVLGPKRAAISLGIIATSAYILMGALVILNYLSVKYSIIVMFAIPYTILFWKLISNPAEENGSKIFPIITVVGISSVLLTGILYIT